jgi:hypothetical protein
VALTVLPFALEELEEALDDDVPLLVLELEEDELWLVVEGEGVSLAASNN